MSFDDFFDFNDNDFVIDPDELHPRENNEDNAWDSGIDPDIFASGEKQDIFTTKTAPDIFST